MLPALNEAKAAGFTGSVSCHRNGGSGEHPKGRACDFFATTGGFGGVATGAAREYGKRPGGVLHRERRPAGGALRDLVQADLATQQRLEGVQRRQP
jgi:hypothetical protein